MDPNRAIPFGFQAGNGQLSFSNRGSSVTWFPPTPLGSNNENGVSEDEKKSRRVQVDVDDLGVSVLRLGSDMTFDFRAVHAEAEKIVGDITSERDELQRQLQEAISMQQKELSDVHLEKNALEEKCSRLQKVAKELETANNFKAAECTNVREKLNTTTAEKHKVIDDVSRLKDANHSLRTDLEWERARNHQSSKEAPQQANSDCPSSEAQQKVHQLEIKIRQLTKKVEEHNVYVMTKNDECERLRQDVSAKASQIYHIGNRNTELNDVIRSRDQDVSRLEEDLRILNDRNTELQIEMDELERSNNDEDDRYYSSPRATKKRTPKRARK